MYEEEPQQPKDDEGTYLSVVDLLTFPFTPEDLLFLHEFLPQRACPNCRGMGGEVEVIQELHLGMGMHIGTARVIPCEACGAKGWVYRHCEN